MQFLETIFFKTKGSRMPSQEFGLQEVIFTLIVTLMEKKALVIHKTVYYDYYYYY